MHPVLRYVFLVAALLWYPAQTALAARSITIAVSPDSLTGEEELTVTASPSGFTEGEVVYVKGAFFISGSTNYFGFSRIGDTAWTKNIETALTQPKVIIGQWNNHLLVKSDAADSGYQGEGEYYLKLGFYYFTGSGSLSPVQWSANTVAVVLRDPPPVPTASPTVTPSCTPGITPTVTPFPTKTPAPTVAPTRRSVSAAASRIVVKTATGSSDILGVSRRLTAAQEAPVATLPGQTGARSTVFALLSVGVGLGLLASATAFQRISGWKKQQKEID